MNTLLTSLVSLLFATSALAAPGIKHHHHFHHKGTGTGTGGVISSTAGPFPIGNGTVVGPTGTGTAVISSVGLAATTIIVSPVPVSSSAAAVPASSDSECGSATVTVTAANVVTVTVGTDSTTEAAASSSAAAGGASSSAVYPAGNSTVVGPSGSAGPIFTGTAYSTSPVAIPTYTYPAASSSAAAGVGSVTDTYTYPAASSSAAAGVGSVTDTYTYPAASSSAAAGVGSVSSASISAVDNHHPHSWTSVMVSPPVESTPIASSSEAPIPASTSTSIDVPPLSPAPSSTAAATSTFVPPPPSTTAAATTTEVPVPSTTIAATTAPSPPSGGGGSYAGPKRGIVYNTASLAAPFAQASAVGWGYNWGSSAGGLASNLNYVPMLWGSNVGSFASDVASAIKSGADSVMAMNEPDQPTQYGGSAITPGNAAQIYKTNIAPLAGSVKVGAPAVSNGNSSSPLMGVQWLSQFFEACSGSGCPVDFVPLHWYGWNGGTAQQQAQAFKDYVTKASAEVHQMSGVNEFWITEFSALPLNNAQINADFMGIVLPWLDSDPAAAKIARYSYFMVSDGLLLSGSSLTASGKAYISDA